jgi:hemolysin activation/secretion protein
VGNQGFSADVIQVESDTRAFIQFQNHWVLALRLNAAYTWGDPSYSFHYSLGGVDQLRGYHTNRFLGKDFYDTQTELRIPVIQYLTLNLSVDAGDITDDQFGPGPLWSFQVGLRSNLLAFSGAVLRLETGFGQDQTNFIISASEPF